MHNHPLGTSLSNHSMLEEIGNDRYIVELIGRAVQVSVESQGIVKRLPSAEVEE